MQKVLKREVGYGSRRLHVRRRHDDRFGPYTPGVEEEDAADVTALLRSVDTSLDGEVHLSVLVETPRAGLVNLTIKLSPAGTPSAVSAEGIAESVAALVRDVASNGEMSRSVRITVARRPMEIGSASAAGITPGLYLVLDIEPDADSTYRPVARVHPVDPGIGLAAARAITLGAGGCIGLSRAGTGGARYTVYLPVRSSTRPMAFPSH